MTKLRMQAVGLSLLLNLLVIPVSMALGLGDVSVRSALNQPLDAAIEVISASKAELKGISATLASAKAFENARIERPAYLEDLEFAVKSPAGAAPFVHISTERPFREPFVHLLLEVNWAKGRLRREYTLLLDPPSIARPAAQPAPRASRAAGKSVAAATATRSASRSAPASSANTPKQYGPTGDTETLWGISLPLAKSKGVSTQQMMVGFLNANPPAFYGDNINSMKPNVTLRVPDVAEIRQVSRGDAIRKVGEHNAYWKQIGGDPTRLPLRAGQTASEPRPAAAAPREKPKPPAAEKKLKIVTPKPPARDKKAPAVADPVATAAVEALNNELTLANEAAESRRLENNALKGRLSRLEENVEKMQRLISLKDDEIASLQQRVSGLQQAARESLKTAAQAPPHGQTAPPAASPAKAVTAPAPATEPAAAMAPTPAAAPTAAPTAASGPAPVAKPRVKPIIYDPMAVEEPSFIGQILDDPMSMMLLVGVAVLLLLLVLYKVRSKSAESDDDDADDEAEERMVAAVSTDESVADAEPVEAREADHEDQDPEPKAAKKAAEDDQADRGPFGIKALLARFMNKGSGKKDAGKDGDKSALGAGVAAAAAGVAAAAALTDDDEAGVALDPLEEANALIADGRLEDAISAIERGLVADPGNEALQLKLMEVFALNGDSSSFETRAEAFYADRDGLDDATWKQVVNWGRPLCPQNPLFMDEAPDLDDDLAFDSDLVELDDLNLGDDLDGLDSDDMDLGADLGLYAVDTPSVPARELEKGAEKGPETEPPEETAAMGVAEIEDLLSDELMEIESALPEDTDSDSDTSGIPGLEMEFGDLDEVDHAIDLSGIPSERDEIVIPPSSNASSNADSELDKALDPIDQAIETGGVDEALAGLAKDPEPAVAAMLTADTVDSAAAADDEIEFDLSALSLPETDAQPELAEDDGEIEFDLGDDSDLDEVLPEPDAMSASASDDVADLEGMDLGSEFADDDAGLEEPTFTASDEVDTKLDLARAYIDMGDPDGARTMLDEVLEDGNADQKKEAEALVSQIG